ncbi:Ras GTPase-activating protein-binding protein 1,Ras GTPase-activating protein-binding protein 2 [Mytilus edulis]|uniref:Ras GTPase-activating protein-binding protein 1,Ras GTPase-activating protein-binding protein 2 n=1 Tax=Mytilus edulis TaxID=6550 RepID=A0A8S3UKX4_MYTED|nr:Ras GTPase-activating protein-binding protein 1,Ras GTPase-activating protein-binding protein 2 [Mytilus edulis]
MADIDWSDDEQINDFFNDGDSEDDFEGFGPEDLEDINHDILANLPIFDFSPENDRDFPDDLGNGWSRQDTDVLNAPFTGESKLNHVMQSNEPLDFMKLFITDDFINELVFQTNKYAEVKANDDESLKENSRIKKWQVVTLDEMKVFLSLIIAMGLVKKSDIQQYWSNSEVMDTPFFRNYMSRDRFLAIHSNLHLVDNERQVQRGHVGFDPLFKIHPFITLIMERFPEVYTPEKELSFDEGTCGWKGNLRFKVYNPAKPTKFGIKLYEVCEASSGYCIGFDVYTGCSEIGEQADLVLGENNCNITTKVVIGLMSRCGLLDNGHHVYMDNYYVSPELFTELEVLNTYACGTLRKNRLGVPDALKKTNLKLKRGEVIFRRKEGLLAVKFHDKRDVHMLSTIHPATVSVLNKNDRRTNNPIVKPTCVVDYCSYMGGVDLSDQINQYYSCLRKTSKWYKKLFFYLLNLCVINSFILYKKYAPVNKTKKEHNTFRTSIVTALIQEAVTAPRPQIEMGRKILGEKPTRLLDRHFPNHIPAKVGAKNAHPARDCVAYSDLDPVDLTQDHGQEPVQQFFDASPQLSNGTHDDRVDTPSPSPEEEDVKEEPINTQTEEIFDLKEEETLETQTEEAEPDQSGQMTIQFMETKTFSWAGIASKNATSSSVPSITTSPPFGKVPQSLSNRPEKTDIGASAPGSGPQPQRQTRPPRDNRPRERERVSMSRDDGDSDSQSGRPRSRFPDSHQLFVGNLPHNITEKELEDFFTKFGHVVELRINTKSSGGKLPNFGFVIFDSPEPVQSILSQKPIKYNGEHRLNVEEKKPRGGAPGGGRGGPPRGGMGGGRGGTSFGSGGRGGIRGSGGGPGPRSDRGSMGGRGGMSGPRR